MHISFVTEAPVKMFGPPVSTFILLCQSTIVHPVSLGKTSAKIDNFTPVSVSRQSMFTGGGATLGALLGATEGSELGSEDRLIVGALDGWTEGLEVGLVDGPGDTVSDAVGAAPVQMSIVSVLLKIPSRSIVTPFRVTEYDPDP
jgi:hypothetical protein